MRPPELLEILSGKQLLNKNYWLLSRVVCNTFTLEFFLNLKRKRTEQLLLKKIAQWQNLFENSHPFISHAILKLCYYKFHNYFIKVKRSLDKGWTNISLSDPIIYEVLSSESAITAVSCCRLLWRKQGKRPLHYCLVSFCYT